MSNSTLENLSNYIESTASKREISISCGEGKINVDFKSLFDINKISLFIDNVVSETYLDVVKPNYFYRDVAFISYFLNTFTDFPISSKQTGDGIEIDSQVTYSMAMFLNIYNNIMLMPEIQNLYDYINKQIEFRNAELLARISTSSASNEFLEVLSSIANQGLNAINKVCDILDNVKDSSLDGDILQFILKNRSDGDNVIDLNKKKSNEGLK